MNTETKEEIRKLAEEALAAGDTVAMQPQDIIDLLDLSMRGRARDRRPWQLEAIEMLNEGSVSVASLYDVGHKYGLREATVAQWLARKTKRGELERVESGLYKTKE